MSTTTQIIDGKAIAARLRARIAQAVAELKAQQGLTPGLAVVLVGGDPASQVYVRNKNRQTEAAGMASFEHRFPENISEEELLDTIARLNKDPAVHGILVQLPLPPHIDALRVLEAIDPAKDVDGFHPMNVGRLSSGMAGLVPCTPLGCILLAKSVTENLEGLEAVVIGRSNIVGKPAAQLLLAENCTVTLAHSRTRNLPQVAARADLLIAAAGRPQMVKGDWIKKGAIVIDVGINRIEVPESGQPGPEKDTRKTRLVGDVDFAQAQGRARAITPVPGGVGPMTIACLLRNTLQATCDARGIDMAELGADPGAGLGPAL